MESIEERRKNILKLRNEGKSYSKIASELQETKSYVAYVCKESIDHLNKSIDRERKKKRL